LGTRRTEPVVAAGQQSLVTPLMERPLARRVTVGMAAKELLSDTVAYFNHLLTSALLRSSNTLKRKNGKRLAKLGREEETGNVKFREWLEEEKRKADKEDDTESRRDRRG
jgi:hypothetical protein